MGVILKFIVKCQHVEKQTWKTALICASEKTK